MTGLAPLGSGGIPGIAYGMADQNLSTSAPYASYAGFSFGITTGRSTVCIDLFQNGSLLEMVNSTQNPSGQTTQAAESITINSFAAVPLSTNILAGNSYVTSNLGTTVNPDFRGGTLQVAAGSAAVASNFNLGAVTGNTIDANGNRASFSGAFTGPGGLTVTDSSGTASTVQLGNRSGTTYAGVTAVTGATLQAGAVDAFSPSSAVVLANVAGTRLDLNGYNQTINGLSGGGAQGGNVSLSAGLINNGGGTYAGIMSGNGGLEQAGGTQTLSGVNTYAGATAIDRGATLALSGNGSISSSTAVIDNGTFDVSQASASARIMSLGGNGSVVLGNTTLRVLNARDTFAGVISGNGSLAVMGGTLGLSGANTYAGGNLVSDGATLQITGAGTLGATDGSTYILGGTLDLGGTTQAQNGGLTLYGGTLQNGTFISSSGFSTAGGTVSAALAGAGGIMQSGGVTTLSGANSYTGGTNVRSGTLQVVAGGTLGASSGFIWTNSLVDLGGTTQTQNGGLQLNGGIVQNGTLVSNSVFRLNGGTESAVMAGSAQLYQIGAGSVISGANSYTGGSLIYSGVLQIMPGGTLGDVGGATTIDAAGELDLGGTNQTQNGGLTMSGGGLGNGTLTSSSAFNLSGGAVWAALAGNGQLVQNAGITTVSGVNSYTGGTWVQGGTLQLATGVTLGDIGGVVTVYTGGVLDLGGTAQTQNGYVNVAGGTLQNGTISTNSVSG